LSQKEICKKYKTITSVPKNDEKLGIAIETIGQQPINGLRHKSQNGTCGWYIWCGERINEEDEDFFKPLHVSHIQEYLPEVEQYLALPTGYRFLVADEYEDVWYDESIIKV